MSEPHEEFAALRAVDPVDQSSLPSAHDPKARALFERITMTDVSSRQLGSPRRRAPIVMVAAAVIVLVIAALAVGLGGDGGDGGSSEVATDTTTTAAAVDEPITPGGGSASCVELYDLTTLTNREVAFDGTVELVDGDRVTFQVNDWYKGGDGAQVTLAGAGTIGGLTSAGEGVSLEPGTRLLVAGDGGFAWSCGFTQPYDAAAAAEWEAALAR